MYERTLSLCEVRFLHAAKYALKLHSTMLPRLILWRYVCSKKCSKKCHDLWYCDIVMECDISYINQICPFSIHNCFAWTLLVTLKGWVVSSWRKISAKKWNWGWVVWHQWKKSANIIGNGVGGCFLCGCRFFQHMFRKFFPDPPLSKI